MYIHHLVTIALVAISYWCAALPRIVTQLYLRHSPFQTFCSHIPFTTAAGVHTSCSHMPWAAARRCKPGATLLPVARPASERARSRHRLSLPPPPGIPVRRTLYRCTGGVVGAGKANVPQGPYGCHSPVAALPRRTLGTERSTPTHISVLLFARVSLHRHSIFSLQPSHFVSPFPHPHLATTVTAHATTTHAPTTHAHASSSSPPSPRPQSRCAACTLDHAHATARLLTRSRPGCPPCGVPTCGVSLHTSPPTHHTASP
jgi:hypothetical protein